MEPISIDERTALSEEFRQEIIDTFAIMQRSMYARRRSFDPLTMSEMLASFPVSGLSIVWNGPNYIAGLVANQNGSMINVLPLVRHFFGWVSVEFNGVRNPDRLVNAPDLVQRAFSYCHYIYGALRTIQMRSGGRISFAPLFGFQHDAPSPFPETTSPAQNIENILDALTPVMNAEEVTTCAICKDFFQSGENIVRLRCHDKHILHRSCLKAWWLNSMSCPICRAGVDGQPSR